MANPILRDGEPGLVKGTRQIKFGDGFSPWIDLPFGSVDDLNQLIDDFSFLVAWGDAKGRAALVLLDDEENTLRSPHLDRVTLEAARGNEVAARSKVVDDVPFLVAWGDDTGRAALAVLDDEDNTIQNPWLGKQFALVAEMAGGSRLPKIATFGDSRTDFNSTGASIFSHGYIYHLQYLTGNRFYFDDSLNFGVNGDTTALMVARLATVVAAPADIVIVLGGTNDRNSGSTITAAQTIANLTTIRDTLLAAKKTVIFIAEMPRGDAAFPALRLTGSQLAYHLRVREWLLAQRAAKGCFVADPWPSMVDYSSATADAKTNMHRDGIHEGPLGALRMAQALAPIITTILPPAPSRLAAGAADFFSADNPDGNLLGNGALTGVGGTKSGTVTGDVADGWTVSAPAGVTIAASIVTDADGTRWQQMAISGATTGGVVAAYFQRAISTPADVAAGDVIEAVNRFQIDAGATGYRSEFSNLRAVVGGANIDASSGAVATDSIGIAEARSGIQQNPRLTLSAAPTSVTLRMSVQFIAATTIAMTIRFALPAIRKVI